MVSVAIFSVRGSGLEVVSAPAGAAYLLGERPRAVSASNCVSGHLMVFEATFLVGNICERWRTCGIRLILCWALFLSFHTQLHQLVSSWECCRCHVALETAGCLIPRMCWWRQKRGNCFRCVKTYARVLELCRLICNPLSFICKVISQGNR